MNTTAQHGHYIAPECSRHFCHVEASERPTAITIALHEAIATAGGLTQLCIVLGTFSLHQTVELSTKQYIQEIEAQAMSQEVTAGHDGSVNQAITAMCARSSIDPDTLSDIVPQTGFIAPIVFYSGYMLRHMASNDLTVYAL